MLNDVAAPVGDDQPEPEPADLVPAPRECPRHQADLDEILGPRLLAGRWTEKRPGEVGR